MQGLKKTHYSNKKPSIRAAKEAKKLKNTIEQTNRICPECGTENNVKANFCNECGSKLVVKCDCWVKGATYNCGKKKCPGYNLLITDKSEAKELATQGENALERLKNGKATINDLRKEVGLSPIEDGRRLVKKGNLTAANKCDNAVKAPVMESHTNCIKDIQITIGGDQPPHEKAKGANVKTYITKMEIYEDKLEEIMTRLQNAQKEIYNCYVELNEIGILTIREKESVADQLE